MATFGERFKTLRNEKQLTQDKLAEMFFLNKSSISRYESDKQLPEPAALQKFADFYNVSLDYLMGISDIRKPSGVIDSKLDVKELRDIAKDLEKVKKELLESDELMFDGHPMSEDSINNILAALEIGMEQVRRKNKAKYTPKKFKGE